jgi:hypothetical protein
MTTAADRLIGIRAKLERTKKHVADLDDAIRTFLASNPYKVATKHDPKTRKLIYYVSHVEEVPVGIIPQIAADAIGNMVSILDHLAYGLFLKDTGGTGGPGRHVYFPIGANATNATDYKTSRERKVKGMAQATIDALDDLEPYQGGKGHQLWVLNELNNLTKHRDLIAVGSRFRSMDLGAHVMATFRKAFGEKIPGIPDMPVFFRPADPLCPLKVGDELFIDAIDAEVNEKMKFAFDVAINEPHIIQAAPLIETVHHLADLVDGIITQFVPFL